MDIEEYLLDHPANRKNLEELLKSYSREIFVPFVGAGPSVPLGGPDYPELLNKMRTEQGIKAKVKQSSSGTDYPLAFSRLCKKVGDRRRFYQLLFKSLQPTVTHFTALHNYLPSVFDAFVTTNYDFPIEEAYERERKKKLQKHYFSCYDLSHLRDCVVYLHGHEKIGFAVIKKEDYDYFYPTVSMKNGIPIIEAFLEELYVGRSILFLGVSFSDGYVLKWLTQLGLKYGNGKHFWILEESTPIYDKVARLADDYSKKGRDGDAKDTKSGFYERFNRLGIKPIVYRRDKHIFLEDVMLRLEKKPIVAAKVSADEADQPE
jgi:hypothetical protein